MKSLFILFLLFCAALNLSAQDDGYKTLKNDFDRLRKEEKNDSALLIAKQMSAWALINEGDTSILFALSFSDIANVFFKLKHNDSAIFYYKKSIYILKKQKRQYGFEYASTLNNLGNLYNYMGDYSSAKPLYINTLEIRKNIFGEQSIEYAGSLNNLGVTFYNLGDYKMSLEYLNHSLEVRKIVLGRENLQYSSSLNNIGLLLMQMGDFKSAENYIKQSLEISSKLLGKNDLKNTQALNNLGLLNYDIADFKSAEVYFSRAKDIQFAILGEFNSDYARSLVNLANLYIKTGNYKTAESFLKQALVIRYKIHGANHPGYSSTLNILGNLYIHICNYDSAEFYLKKAVDIKSSISEKYTANYSEYLNNLGYLYYKTKDYNQSEINFKLSIKNFKLSFGEQHPNYLSCFNNLALVYSNTNKIEEAISIYKHSSASINRNINNDFQWLNDKQTELYWQQFKVFYNTIDQFSTQYSSKFPEISRLCYNSNLIAKGKLLEAKINKDNSIYLVNDSLNNKIDSMANQLSFLRKKVAKLEVDGDGNQYKQLNAEADSLDKALTLLWPQYATQKKNLSITWDQVQSNLSGDEAAIEFVRYKSDKDSQYYYNALIVRKTDVYPVLVPLCSENQLKEVLNKGFSAYYPLVWAPINTYLKEIKTIYYSPVGMLNKIPFAALYTQTGDGDQIFIDKKSGKINTKSEPNANYLMNRYTLHQLTSTRYLAMGLKEKSLNKIDKSIALIGGVNYDYLPGVKKKTVKKEMLLASREANFTQPLGYLAGTKLEVDAISKQMQNNGWETTLLENDSATEENVIKYENQFAKGILHISTHGFAYPNIKELPPKADSSISKNNFCYYTNPLQRCGLILAGANWAWLGKNELKQKNPEAEDGILTAAQVALLNLKKTKLVVLSACETGLGKIEGSEGVIGLTRAFKLAGVEQIIVSLWEVPDKETMELMTLFYDYLSKTQNAIVSFEKAQKAMSLKYPIRPDLWAGFVLVR